MSAETASDAAPPFSTQMLSTAVHEIAIVRKHLGTYEQSSPESDQQAEIKDLGL